MIYARHSFGKRKEKKKRNRGLVLRVGPHFGPTQRPGGEKMVVGWRDGPGWPVGGGLLAADGVPGPPLGAGLGPAARKQVHGRLRVHGGVSGPLAGSWWTWSTLSLLFFGPRRTGCSQEVLSPSFPPAPLSHGADGQRDAPATASLAQRLLPSTLGSAPASFSAARLRVVPFSISPCRQRRNGALCVEAGPSMADARPCLGSGSLVPSSS